MSTVPEHSVTKASVARFWAFTWFPGAGIRPLARHDDGEGAGGLRVENYTAANLGVDYNWPICSVGADEECQGLVFQIEVCPDSGREHVQGYAEFSKPCRFTHAQAVLGIGSAHVESRKKTREACVKYCTKDETRKAGTFPALLGVLACQDPTVYKSRQGKRTDISAMVDAIKSGKRALECIESDPDTYVKYSRGMQEVRRVMQQAAATRIRPDMRVTVYWGAAGSGKTRKVYDDHGVENVFTLIADNSACWFDGYEGQDVLLIDDFKGWIQYSMLLKLLDIYPMRVPVKGSFTYAGWSKVYITSNYAPETWYTGDHDPAALARRLHVVKRFGEVHRAATAGLPRSVAAGGPREPAYVLEGGSAGAGGAHAPGFVGHPLRRSPADLTPAALRIDYNEQTDNDDDDGSQD